MMLDSVTGIAKYLHTRGFLFLLLEIIMGKDSPFAKEKVKIQEMPISHMKPIWYIVVVLIERCAEEDKPGMIRKGDFVLSEK